MPAGRPAHAIGVVLAVLYAVLSIAFSVGDLLSKAIGWSAVALTIAESMLFLLVAPLLVWVNRINADRPEVVAAHSQWQPRTWVALAFGVSMWAVFLIADLMPDA